MVSNIFYFHPYLGKIPILTNIFQMGWNHQPVTIFHHHLGRNIFGFFSLAASWPYKSGSTVEDDLIFFAKKGTWKLVWEGEGFNRFFANVP